MIQGLTLPRILRSLLLLAMALVLSYSALGQSLTAGTVSGTVTDPNNAVVPNATVTIENAVTGYKKTVNSGADGTFRFNNVPLNNYTMSVSAPGFGSTKQTLNVRTSVPINSTLQLAVAAATETVMVTGANASDTIENVSSAHTDV